MKIRKIFIFTPSTAIFLKRRFGSELGHFFKVEFFGQFFDFSIFFRRFSIVFKVLRHILTHLEAEFQKSVLTKVLALVISYLVVFEILENLHFYAFHDHFCWIRSEPGRYCRLAVTLTLPTRILRGVWVKFFFILASHRGPKKLFLSKFSLDRSFNVSSQLVSVTEKDIKIRPILINSEFILFIMNLLNSWYAYSNLNLVF